MATPRYSFVIPLFDEEESLPELAERLVGVMTELDGDAEVLLVDDGSSDRTFMIMSELSASDPRFRALRLSRNFGHQLAITAGLDRARGDAVVVMDGDLQDPPELVHELIRCWRDGYEVVYAVRADRGAEPFLKRTATSVFYRVLRRLTDLEIPVDVGDFRLVDRRALDEFRKLREQDRYIRGLFAWVGFSQIGVPYKRDARYAGQTKYPFRKLVKLGADGVVSFSKTPLKLALTFGFIFSFASFVYGISAIVKRILGIGYVPGWASVVAVVTFIGGVQLIIMGVMGIYVGRIYDEVKRRPLYVIRDERGFDETTTPSDTTDSSEAPQLASSRRS